MADWWSQYILRNAPRYRVDPRAALAIASVEGLGGGVGDQGTSFGPFQLHVGGALPTGRGRAWAESQAGLDYALRQIGQVAGGLRGQAAISAIASRFERPRDVAGEIRKALAAYGGGPPLPAGSLGDSVANMALPGGPPPRTLKGSQGQKTIMRQTRVFDPLAYSQNVLSALASGGVPDAGAAASAYKNIQVPVQVPLPPQMQAALQKLPAKAQQQMAQVLAKNGWAVPAHGKVIGTPYHGTHTLGNWESDRALDVSVPIGTPIYSPFGGTIGSQFGSLGAGAGSRFAGLRLHVASPQNEWYAAHLSRFAPGIRPGVRVRPGQLVGYSGSASGVAHLHEALRSGDPYRLIR